MASLAIQKFETKRKIKILDEHIENLKREIVAASDQALRLRGKLVGLEAQIEAVPSQFQRK